MLIAARAIQGAGAALVPAARPGAAERGVRRPSGAGRRSARFSAITGIAVAVGPLVGGAVVQGIDWQWIFWINVPIGADRDSVRCARIDRRAGGRTPRSTCAAWRW